MNTIPLLAISVLTLSFSNSFASEPEEKKSKPSPPAKSEAAKTETVKLRFVPEGGPWKGETPFKGASWSMLRQGLTKGVLDLHARAGVGDKFPVQEKAETTLFEVAVISGDDAKIAVEVRSTDKVQKVELKRDKAVEVEVNGVKYRLLFPTSSVSAAPGENPTTNKAGVFVSRRIGSC